jgi:ribosome maturation factor RimP
VEVGRDPPFYLPVAQQGDNQRLAVNERRQLADVESLIGESIAAMGYALVQVRMLGSGGQPTLQVMAERVDGAGMTVDDCAEVSHVVSALLDVEDPVSGAYMLEVSSPGIDRPLTRLEDFTRFAGYEAKLETRRMVAGRRRFRGRLAGVDGRYVNMAVPEGNGEKLLQVPYEDIEKAKLVLTDELIQASLRRARQAAEADAADAAPAEQARAAYAAPGKQD